MKKAKKDEFRGLTKRFCYFPDGVKKVKKAHKWRKCGCRDCTHKRWSTRAMKTYLLAKDLIEKA